MKPKIVFCNKEMNNKLAIIGKIIIKVLNVLKINRVEKVINANNHFRKEKLK